MKIKKLSKASQKKFIKNLLKFTAPALSVLFGQLALGANFYVAALGALYILFALLQDYFSKIK